MIILKKEIWKNFHDMKNEVGCAREFWEIVCKRGRYVYEKILWICLLEN